MLIAVFLYLVFFKQKTAYELRISDWSSDVCSSDLDGQGRAFRRGVERGVQDQRGHRDVSRHRAGSGIAAGADRKLDFAALHAAGGGPGVPQDAADRKSVV